MARSEPGLEQRIFGGRWAVAVALTEARVGADRGAVGRPDRVGRAGSGERLPPERDLADALHVSRMTVRQALASLAARGMVERGVGRGTFVREAPRVLHDLTRVAGFAEEVERQGMEAGAQLIEATRCPAPETVAERAGPGPRTSPPCGSSGSASGAAGR